MAEDAGILQEIDEALRADKLSQLWARHSGSIIAFCVLVVLTSAASAFWKNHQREVHERQTGKLTQATMLADTGKYNEAMGMFEQIEGDGGPLGAIASLKHAQTLIDMKQQDKALTVYNDLASDKHGGAPDVFRDYAALQADIMAHNQTWPDKKPAASTDGWAAAMGGDRAFATAFAELNALRSGDSKNASALLDGVVSNKDAPFSERERAAQLLDSLKGPAK